MPIKTACPKVSVDIPADHVTVIAAGFGATDLTAISRRPCQAAQRIVVVNRHATTLQSVVFRGEDDIGDTTMAVPFNSTLEVRTPVKALAASGADIEVHAYWHAGAGCNYNK